MDRHASPPLANAPQARVGVLDPAPIRVRGTLPRGHFRREGQPPTPIPTLQERALLTNASQARSFIR